MQSRCTSLYAELTIAVCNRYLCDFMATHIPLPEALIVGVQLTPCESALIKYSAIFGIVKEKS